MGGWLFCSGAQGECLGWRYTPGPPPRGGGVEVMGVAEISQRECVQCASSRILSLFVFRGSCHGEAEAFCVFVSSVAVTQGGVVNRA